MPVDSLIEGNLAETLGATGTATNVIKSGSLPTVSLTSGTGKQINSSRDVTLCVDTSTAGSAVVALSPDGTTYSNVQAVTTRATDCLVIPVPAAWRVKVTLTTSTMGTATYY